MDFINNSLRRKIKLQTLYEKEKRKDSYWICIKNKGAIPKALLKFKEQREYYRQLGNEPMSQALMVMMNSIYGLFGSDGIFAFQDYRVAELVTAFARIKLLEMKSLANEQFQMKIIYRDTDSIFVSGTNNVEQNPHLANVFTATCKRNLGIDVDHQNTFVKYILFRKKHYIGILPDGKVIIKGMEGKKRDSPPFFNQVFSQLVDDYKNNSGPDLTFNILKAFKQLEAAQVDPSLLAYSIVLSKDPDYYQSYTPQHKIGKTLNRESGSLIKFYKTGQQEDGYNGYSTDYRDLNIDVYKTELWKLVRDVLCLLNCNMQELEDEIFPTIAEDDKSGQNTTGHGNAYSSNVWKRNHNKNNAKANNIQSNESLDKYQLLVRFLSV
jgi:DNA polymerase I